MRDRDPLRVFGLVIGGVIAGALAVRATIQNTELSWWAMAIAGLLVLTALVRPSALRPLHSGWMRLARALAWINTRILLGLVFYGILAPTGLVMRLAGRDALRLRPDPDAATYAVPRRSRPSDHMRRQF